MWGGLEGDEGVIVLCSVFCWGGKLQLASLQCLLQLKSVELPSPPGHEPQGQAAFAESLSACLACPGMCWPWKV